MFARRTRPPGRWSRRDSLLVLLPFLPVLLLFATLDILAPFGSPWQKTLEVAAYAIVAVSISFMEVWPFYRKLVRAHIMLSLIFLSYYLTSLEAIEHGTSWMLAITPGAFTCIACLFTRPPFEAPVRRLAICGAVLLFLLTVYLADLLRLWWQPLIISLAVGGCIWLFLRIFSIHPCYRGVMVGMVTVLATVSMVLVSFFLGITVANHTLPGIGAALVACVTAGLIARLLTLKQSMLIWCGLTLLILLSTSLFTLRDSASLILCVLAGLGIAGAAAASWRLPVLPPATPYQPYQNNRVFDGDDVDEEDIPVLNDGEETTVQSEIEDEEDTP